MTDAIIRIDVPDWQIGQEVTVYFPDTMTQKGVCEPLKEEAAGTEECEMCGHRLQKGWNWCPWCRWETALRKGR